MHKINTLNQCYMEQFVFLPSDVTIKFFSLIKYYELVDPLCVKKNREYTYIVTSYRKDVLSPH